MSSRKCEMKTMLRPLSRSPAQHLEQPRDLGRRQGGGRLVEDDDARAGEQHARELDELLHADRKIAEARARVDVEAEVLRAARRLARHAAPGDDAEAADRLRAEKDVLGDGEIGRDAELLMHHADAGGPRVARRAEMHRSAVDAHLACVAGVHAGDDLHQRAFAGAVLAGEAVDLAGLQREIDAAQRLDAAERLGDAGQFEPRRRHRGGLSSGSLRSGTAPPSTACRRRWPW